MLHHLKLFLIYPFHRGLVNLSRSCTVYPKKYAHGFVVLCFVVVMQSFIMNSHELFIHIHQGCFAGTGAIVRLPQCQWSKPDVCGKISQCITTTKHSKAKTVCIFLGIYCYCTCCKNASCSYLQMESQFCTWPGSSVDMTWIWWSKSRPVCITYWIRKKIRAKIIFIKFGLCHELIPSSILIW